MKLKKDDTVIVIAGKDRGKKGKVERVFSGTAKVVVAGINITKKHVKKSSRHEQGGRIEYPSPIVAAKVMLICPHCGKATRVGLTGSGDQKARVCKRCGKSIGGTK